MTLLHRFLRSWRGGYYRLCSHRSHHVALPCFRWWWYDGYCSEHLDTCFHACGPSRWMYRTPFTLTVPWAASIRRGEDEYGNPLVWLQIPGGGALQVSYKKGPLNVLLSDPDGADPGEAKP